MNILVINLGSSSVKTAILDTQTGKNIIEVKATGILTNPKIKQTINDELIEVEKGHEAALNAIFDIYKKQNTDFLAIGHRVVHGAEKFKTTTKITDGFINELKKLNDLAPSHNPNNIKGIEKALVAFKYTPQYAIFDTAFHSTLPNRAKYYAVSSKLTKKHGIRRYGFHGPSHKYVAHKAAEILKTDLANLKVITCHLGNGCSITAVEFGRSVETSMGMTPLEGLVMGARSGDIDPGLINYIAKKENLSLEQVDELLYNESGLKGLSNDTNDMQTIIEKASQGDENCRLAIHVFTHRLRKYIGAYTAVMGGVDVIVFTGGIGENSSYIRHRACQRLDYLGAVIDEDKNRDFATTDGFIFSDETSRVKLLAIPTNEELEMANETYKAHKELFKVNQELTIPVAVSARHVHLTQKAVEVLFGKGYQLTSYKPLSQPGQFACNERVTIVGPKNKIERVRILGPVRSKNQVEISRTDEFFLGVDAPIRASGHVEGSPGIHLVGDKGELTIKEGVICAWRHIHMTEKNAELFKVKDKDIVEVRIQNNERPITFGNVLVRVKNSYALEMHIDTDEGNAAELNRGAEGVLCPTDGQVCLVTKKV
jgi:acetate kinase